MSKILSIIIPTYNMEALLPRCLDSLVTACSVDMLDILVVNDGSRDRSLEVARSYEERFPQSVRVIDKPNGNYGSTINAALPLAVGQFVRILDSDDWYDTAALDKYITELQAIDRTADISVTHFHNRYGNGLIETVKYNVYGREPYEYGHVYDLDEVLGGGYIRYFLMHSLAYRTEMLRENSYHQTEGISYTDTQWATYPLFWAGTIVFHDIVLYEYNLDREGQTMSPEVISRSLPQLGKMTMHMLDFYRNFDVASLSDCRQIFLKQYFRNRLRILAKTHLMDIPRDSFDPASFSDLSDRIQVALSEFDMDTIRLYPENKLIHIDAYRYWLRHHDRLPIWLESMNHITDVIVKRIFMILFHSA